MRINRFFCEELEHFEGLVNSTICKMVIVYFTSKVLILVPY